MEATTATALVLACAESSLPRTAEELLKMAEEIESRAGRCGIPKENLAAAAEKLSLAEEKGRLEAVIELGREAAALGEQAAALARACDGFGRLVTAIKLVRDAEKKEVPQPSAWSGRIKAWWASWRESCGMKKEDPEALQMPLLDRSNPCSSQQGAPGGNLPSCSQVMDKMCGMHASALFRSLALVPHLGSNGLLKPPTFDDDYRRFVCTTFSYCWGLVGLGVSCSHARSSLLRTYARLSCRLCMLGITILVIFFCHWLLDPTGPTPWPKIFLAGLLHILVFLWSRREGDV